MKSILFLATLLALVASGCTQTTSEDGAKEGVQTSETNTELDAVTAAFSIEILEPKGRRIIDPKAKIEVVAKGFTWTEGPLWVEDGEYLLFSDIPKNKVYKLTAAGDTSTYLYPSGKSGPITEEGEPGSNGLLLSPAGELILLQHGDRRVAKMMAPLSAPNEEYVTVVGDYQGKRFNSPNDGTFDLAGNIYFTDPPYGLPGSMDDPDKELDFQGVYFMTPDGEAKLVDTFSYPNGVALSPDGARLYVAVSDPEHAVWYQYDIVTPGVVTNKKILHDLTHLVGLEGEQGLPDGLKVNKDGYVFATGAGGVWIFNPEGRPVARIHTGQLTANCAIAYGGRRLYMTANNYILSVDLK